MTDYVWRMHVMVPVSHAAPAADAAMEALPGGEAERFMFGVPLQRTRVPSGQQGMLGCSVLLTERLRADLMAALMKRGVEAVWVRLDASDSHPVEVSDGRITPTGRTWEWDDTLAAIECRTMTEVGDGG